MNKQESAPKTGDIGMRRKVYEIVLYDVPEIATTLNISKLTVLNYIKRGKLKAQKIGRRWWISQSNLEDFLNAKQENLKRLENQKRADKE